MRGVLVLVVALGACGSGEASGGDDDAPPPPGSLFSRPMPWTRDVSAVSPSPESDTIIGALDAAGGWGTGDFRTDYTIRILGGSGPMVDFTPKDDTWAEANLGDPDLAEFYRPDCDDGQVPLPAGGSLENEDGYACTTDGDCHLIVVDSQSRKLYEMWRADQQGGELLGGCLAVWDLDRDYGDTLRGKGCSSADAGGFPITAMLVTPDEVASGHVDHALRFILPNDRIRDGIYVAPATHSTFPTSGGPDLPPYGVRLRLKASFDESTLGSEGARVVARALKQYGMFLSDGGSLPLTMASDRGYAHSWDELGMDARSLSSLQVTDFEVVELGELVDYKANTDCEEPVSDQLAEKFGRKYPAGTQVFREGDRGSEMFIIHVGRVQISRVFQGRETVIAELPAGEFFGEMALLNGRPRSATATVVEDAELIVVGGKQLEAMLRARTEIAVRLIRAMASRLERANQQIELLLLKDNNHRVVQCLRQFADSVGLPIQGSGAIFLPVSLAALAGRVGLDESQVTEVLGKLVTGRMVMPAREVGIEEEGYVIPEVGRLVDFLEYLELRERFG